MHKEKKRMKLIELRKSIGSQSKVAQDLRISRQFLSAIENCERNPTIKLMVIMSSYFKVDEREIFSDLFFNNKCHNSLQCKSKEVI